jgi:phosphonate transport system substrate-binding protein
MNKLKILLFSILLFCCFVSVNIFAQERNEITVAILKGDDFANYSEQITNAIKEKLNKKAIIKILDYDVFVIDLFRGNSDFYKGSPLTYVLSLSDTVILKSVYKINNEWQVDYTPVILARTDKDINDVKDLKHKKFYFTNPNSASGYLYPKLFLIENGVYLGKEFSNDYSNSAEDVYKYVLEDKWDACCSFYGLLDDDPLFENNSSIKIFEINSKIPNDPLWVNDKIKKENPQLVSDIKNLILERFKDNATISFVQAHDRDYASIRRKVRILGIIENKDFISVDRLLGICTKNPKTLNFILEYNLHFILAYLIFI